MSGHSKWATIKHKKGAADKARGKLFAKIARQIEVAAREGGGDLSSNASLRTVVQKAKAAQMTNDAIDRAVKRGSGEAQGDSYESITYEGYAPGGVAMMVDTLTDNRTVGVGIVSYEMVAALNEGEQQQEGAIGGVQSVNNRFREDSLYNPFPYHINIHHNQFENSHWFPTMQSDIGKLLLTKSFFDTPDVVYDGIENPKQKERNICVSENGEITFMNLDAANDFKALSKDGAAFACDKKAAMP